MSRRRHLSMQKEQESNQRQMGLVYEAIGLILLCLAAFLLLTLLSHHPDDPSFNYASGSGVIHNLTGKIGAYLSDMLIQFFGYASGWLVIFLLVPGIQLMRSTDDDEIYLDRFMALPVLGLATTILFSLLSHSSPSPDSFPPTGPGGVLGSTLATTMQDLFGVLGSIVLLIPLIVVALMILIRFSLSGLVEQFHNDSGELRLPRPSDLPSPKVVMQSGADYVTKGVNQTGKILSSVPPLMTKWSETMVQWWERIRGFKPSTPLDAKGDLSRVYGMGNRTEPIIDLPATPQPRRDRSELDAPLFASSIPKPQAPSWTPPAPKPDVTPSMAHAFVSEPKPMAQPVTSEFKPAQQPFVSEPRPAQHPFASEPRPAQHPFASEPRPAEHPFASEPRPAQHPFASEPRPAQHPFASEPRPAQQPFASEPRPAQQPFVSEPRPAEQPFVSEPRPAEQSFVSEPRPAEQTSAPESKPISATPPFVNPFSPSSTWNQNPAPVEEEKWEDDEEEYDEQDQDEEDEWVPPKPVFTQPMQGPHGVRPVVIPVDSVENPTPADSFLDDDDVEPDFALDVEPGPIPTVQVHSPRTVRDDDDTASPVGETLENALAPLPPITILGLPEDTGYQGPSREELTSTARLLEQKLEDFKIKGQIINAHPGPVITTYELDPAPGLRAAKVVGLADDLARSISAVSVRVVGNIPGKNVIGIEIPNKNRRTVYLREVLDSDIFRQVKSPLAMALGSDINGRPVVGNLAKMPHLLVAGTTGSGKSVAVNAMICSVLFTARPTEVRFLMVDPKMLELSIYEGIPHLLAPVVTDVNKAATLLKWAVAEMEERYRLMSELGVRNLTGYNQRIMECLMTGEEPTRRIKVGFDPETGRPVEQDEPIPLEPKPLIVIIIDELADLMIQVGKDVEPAIARLAQMARAAGLHLIIATQRPSVDVITGLIKANFPTRLAFQVSSKIDSRTILDSMGADRLLGMGDGLFQPPGTTHLQRIHAPFVSDSEVHKLVKFLKTTGRPEYDHSILAHTGGEDDDGIGEAIAEEYDPLYDQAVAVVVRARKVSTSMVQRHFKIGYNRAARIVERMTLDGLVSEPNHAGKREVLTPRPENR
ncbi:MAG: DNA translocase FtsK 4TM domain-containing protein [Magnetococcus sp. YQC-5]